MAVSGAASEAGADPNSKLLRVFLTTNQELTRILHLVTAHIRLQELSNICGGFLTILSPGLDIVDTEQNFEKYEILQHCLKIKLMKLMSKKSHRTRRKRLIGIFCVRVPIITFPLQKQGISNDVPHTRAQAYI